MYISEFYSDKGISAVKLHFVIFAVGTDAECIGLSGFQSADRKLSGSGGFYGNILFGLGVIAENLITGSTGGFRPR